MTRIEEVQNSLRGELEAHLDAPDEAVEQQQVRPGLQLVLGVGWTARHWCFVVGRLREAEPPPAPRNQQRGQNARVNGLNLQSHFPICIRDERASRWQKKYLCLCARRTARLGWENATALSLLHSNSAVTGHKLYMHTQKPKQNRLSVFLSVRWGISEMIIMQLVCLYFLNGSARHVFLLDMNKAFIFSFSHINCIKYSCVELLIYM